MSAPFNLTNAGREARRNPALVPALAAEARRAAAAKPVSSTAPRPALPRRPAPYVPLVGVSLSEEASEAEAPPALTAPVPTMSIARPAVDADLLASLLAAVVTVTTARSDTFPNRGEVLEVLARLKDARDDDDQAPVRVFPAAAAALNRYGSATDPNAADFAGRLAVLLHVEKHGPESTAPLNGETLDLALRTADWHRRVSSPPKAAVSEVVPEPAPAPSTPAPETPAALGPDVAYDAGEPPQPAGSHPGDVQRLKVLLAANAARPLTARDAGRKLKLSAARIREIIAANPGMFQVSEHGTQPSGGRPAQRLALVGPAV